MIDFIRRFFASTKKPIVSTEEQQKIADRFWAAADAALQKPKSIVRIQIDSAESKYRCLTCGAEGYASWSNWSLDMNHSDACINRLHGA
jgi:hypothetical protein